MSLLLLLKPPPAAAGGAVQTVTATAGTPYEGTASVTTATATLPTGLVAGDYTVLVCSANGTTPVISTPTGWTALFPSAQSAASTSHAVAVFYRAWQTGDTDPTVTTTSARLSILPVRIQGADPATFLDTAVGSTSGASGSSSVTAPSQTPATTGQLFVVASGRLGTSGTVLTFTPPTGMTEVGEAASRSTGSSNATGALFVEDVTVGAATGTRTATASTSSTGSRGISFVLKGAPVADPRPTGIYFDYRADDAVADYATITTTGGIVDSSGNNRPNAIPTTTATRPALTTGGAGGHSFLTFDGTDDRLTTSNSTDPSMLTFLNAKPGGTIAAVVRLTAGPIGVSRVIAHIPTTGSAGRMVLLAEASNKWQVQGRRLDGDALQSTSSVADVDTNLHLIVSVNDYANALQYLYIDGQLAGTRAPFQTAGVTSATNSLAFNIGATTTPNSWFAGDLYEILGYDRALTATEVGDLWSYSQDRYALVAVQDFTGAASLTGSGSLTAIGTPRPTGAASLSGAGSLTATGVATVAASGTASFTGSGSLTGVGLPRVTTAAAFTGSGALTAAGTGVALSRAVPLTGSGALTSAGAPAAMGAANLSGAGALTAAGAPTFAGSVALSGIGALTAVTTLAGNATVAFTGSGSLTAAGSSTQAAAGSAALSGAGSLTTAAAFTVTAVAGFTGAGTLTATGTGITTRTAVAFTGAGTLTGATKPSTTATTALTGSGALTATGTALAPGTAAFTGTGALTTTTRLTVTRAVPLTGSGSLTAGPKPATTGTAPLTGSGTLSAAGNATLAFTGAAVFNGSGTLTATAAPKVPGVAALTGSGALTTTSKLTGTGAAQLTGNGALTAAGKPATTATATLTGNGQLTTAAAIAYTAVATLTGSGQLVTSTTYRDITLTTRGPYGNPLAVSAPTGHPLTATTTRHPLAVTAPTGAPLTVGGPNTSPLRTNGPWRDVAALTV